MNMTFVLVFLAIFPGRCEDPDLADFAGHDVQILQMEGSQPEDDDKRDRLSADQLAAYLPERVGPFLPVLDSYRAEQHGDLEDTTRIMSTVILDYKSPLNTSTGSGSFDIRIRIDDLADWSAIAESMRGSFEALGEGTTKQFDGLQTQSRLDDGTLVIEKVRDDAFAQAKRTILIADRFKVSLTAKVNPQSEFDVEELSELLAETFETSPLSELGDAPHYADASPADGLPAWLDEESSGEMLSSISCDDALPVAEIERICGVSGVRVVDTGMASDGHCNRLYKRGDAISGFVFLLSRYDQVEMARRALSVAADTDGGGHRKTLAELGDGGYSFASSTGEARVAFVAANALIELKASDSDLDGPDEKLCLARPHVEEVARSIARRLTP